MKEIDKFSKRKKHPSKLYTESNKYYEEIEQGKTMMVFKRTQSK